MMILRSRKVIIGFKSVKISKSYKMERESKGRLKVIKMTKVNLAIISFIDFTNRAVLNAT
jgi:hypothetical protein